jgi:hypothetical protein
MRFRTREAADEFAEAYNGKPFNSMEVGSFLLECIVFVDSVILA